jgi:Gram-negative bacterial TonB protein C-terminal
MRRILATGLLLPSLFLPAAANASTPVDDASAPTPKVRVSTGVIAPELLGADHLTIAVAPDDLPVPGDAEVGLTLTVDASGHPEDVKVVKTLSPLWDARVVDAVSRAHFKPGTISNEPTPVELNLTVNIAR